MRKFLFMLFFAVTGVFICLGVILVTDQLGIAPRFPVFAGEDDFSIRINYFLFLVIPAFFVIGAWMGLVFSKNRRMIGYMFGGMGGGTIITFCIAYVLSPFINNIASRELANYSVLIFFLSWILELYQEI